MLCHAIEGGGGRGGEGGRRGVGVLPTTCSQGFATSRVHIYSIWLMEKFSYLMK